MEKEFRDHPDYVEKFRQDIDDLKTGSIKLVDFFNPGDIKLKYQEIRSALSMGLLIFSHLVLENNGYIIVSSPKDNIPTGMIFYKSWRQKREIGEIVPLGTFYNIIFPKILNRPPVPRNEIVPFEIPSGESAFTTLLKQALNCGEGKKIKKTEGGSEQKNRLCFTDYRVEGELKQQDIDKIAIIFKECETCEFNGNRRILSIEFKNFFKFDHSDLFRFLAKIQITRDVKSIIVHNVTEEIVYGIISTFKIFRKMNRKIGSNDHFVLFYYQSPDHMNKYFSFLLAGESWDDMCWINKKIARTSYTSPKILQQIDENTNPSAQFQKDFCNNSLFAKNGHLLPFDVLIKRSGLTLFERNVLISLLEPGMHQASPSYMFRDAHMRLGSKIHLKDFFYARRIFQNSFYSLRFAFIICRYIQDNIDKWGIKNEINFPLTILGYGLYSELLISNVTRFLASIYPDWKINHAMIDDAEDLRVMGKMSENIITVIPISSTLSTSRKIEIQMENMAARIICNPINVMIVGNGELSAICDSSGAVTDPVLSLFWKGLDIEKKSITARKTGKEEKFFLYLPSKWYQPQNCELCFPDNPVDETVLFETDKVSVTPSLIFDLPAPKPETKLAEIIHFGEWEESDKKTAVLTKDMLLYGHWVRGNNHYLYYIETTDFLKKNQAFLMGWLEKVKRELIETTPIIFDSKVILIAPTHFTNADFINLVNEIIFNNVATLFHYDQDEDYIQNLKGFFGRDITQEAYVFFIDDAICGGSTFEKLNNFVKYARPGGISRGVDGAFVLINRLMQDKYEVLVKELGKAGFFSFFDLEVPIMIDSDKFCHLCSEKKRYEKMLAGTLLDSLRILIKTKIMKLEETKYEEKDKPESDSYKDILWRYISREKCLFANSENRANYLKRLQYVHKIYRAFSDEKSKNEIAQIFRENRSLEDLCREVGISYPVEKKNLLDEKVTLIKILSYPYFIYHKEIRKYIFKIIILELEQVIDSLLKIRDENLNKEHMNTYRYLKFLIKRAAALKANYLLRENTIKNIFSLYNTLQNKLQGEEAPTIFTLSSNEKKQFLENLHGFVDYYIMAVKEVYWNNEAKSLKFEETLSNMQYPDSCIDQTFSQTFSLLNHSLRIENISIPNQFLNFLEKPITGIDLEFSEKNYNRDIKELEKFIVKYCRDDTYRTAPMLSFLGFISVDEEEPNEIERFLATNQTFQTKVLPMILLKAFFLLQRSKNYETNLMKSEMNYILYCLCKILDIDTEIGGAFFVVKYMKAAHQIANPNLFTIGHIGKDKEMDSFSWNTSFTSRVFEGYKPSFKSFPLTYVQLLEKGDHFLSHYNEKVEIKDVSEFEQLRDMKSFLFLRIADSDLDSTARGVIVFYNNRGTLIEPENLRYAMILKNDIFDFIEKNYENYSIKLYEDRLHQLKDLEALNEVIKKITSAADLARVYEQIEKINEHIGNIDEMCLLTKKGDNYQSDIKCLEQEPYNCEKCKLQKLACIKQIETDKIYYYCPDVEKDPLLQEKNWHGLKTKLIVPLVFNNELLGILDIGSKTKDAFAPFERNLLNSLGSQIAIAINNRIKQDKQGEIYKDISHSLGTYLTTMRLFTQRLIEKKVKEEFREEYLKILYGNVFSLINSVDEISSLANMEYWDTVSISEKVEIMEIIKNLAARNKFLLQEKGLKLQVPQNYENIFIKANRQKLEEALQSIINNAIKFSDNNKKISIQVSSEENYVFIDIIDQGYGIHKEDLVRIFEKYERGRNAKEREITGTGIGLAAAKSIIEKHNGRITVKSELEKGSNFTIKLPIYKE
ncbi:MAG: ATP-binding protein [Candidatus Omnitrophota bacterium]